MTKLVATIWMPVVALAFYPQSAMADGGSAECAACVAHDCIQACKDEGLAEYDVCCESEGGEQEVCVEICGDDLTTWELDCESGHMRGYQDCIDAASADANGEPADACCTSCTDDLGECSVSVDDDGDGIDNDADLCLETAADDVVDGSGCSITDYCPCDGDWRNHGAYVSCVSQAVDAFAEVGLSSDLQISDAAGSDCGKKKR